MLFRDASTETQLEPKQIACGNKAGVKNNNQSLKFLQICNALGVCPQENLNKIWQAKLVLPGLLAKVASRPRLGLPRVRMCLRSMLSKSLFAPISVVLSGGCVFGFGDVVILFGRGAGRGRWGGGGGVQQRRESTKTTTAYDLRQISTPSVVLQEREDRYYRRRT